MDLLTLFYSQKQIMYIPELNRVTNSALATIALSRMVFWWVKMKQRPFFKFLQPCNHAQYTEGDSWCEELGMSRSEFETARNIIATRIPKAVEELPVKDNEDNWLPLNQCIVYWVASHKTYYRLNPELVLHYIELALGEDAVIDPLLAKTKKLTVTGGSTGDTSDQLDRKTGAFTLLEEKMRTWVKVPSLPKEHVVKLNTRHILYDPRIDQQVRKSPNELYDNDLAYRDYVAQELEVLWDQRRNKKSGSISYTTFISGVLDYTGYTNFLNDNLKKYRTKQVEAEEYETIVDISSGDE